MPSDECVNTCCNECEKEKDCTKMVKRCINGCEKCTLCSEYVEPYFQSGLTLLRKHYSQSR